MKKRYIFVAIIIILIGSSYYFLGYHDDYILNVSKYGPDCRIEKVCGGFIGVDCKSAVDGPYYYIDKKTEKIVGYCGGYCISGPCYNCPPDEWSCEIY